MPGEDGIIHFQRDPKQFSSCMEKGFEHPFQRKIGFEFLVRQLQFPLAVAFRPIGYVPGGQGQVRALTAGEVFERFELFHGGRPGLLYEALQEGLHGSGFIRHPSRQGVLDIVAEAQQPGQAMPQREHFPDQRQIIPLFSTRTLVGRACHVGRVHPLSQIAVVRMRHDSVKRWCAEVHHPAVPTMVPGDTSKQVELGARQSLQGRRIFEMQGPCLGGVDQVLRELRPQLAQAHDQLAVGFLLPRRKVDTRQVKVAQFQVDDPLLNGGKGREFIRVPHAAVSAENTRMLLAPVAVFGQALQGFVVSLAQGLAVGHGIEVGDRRPGAAQLFSPCGFGVHHGPVGSGTIVQPAPNTFVVFLQQHIQGWHYVLRFDGRKFGKAVFMSRIQERVFHL